MNNLNELLLELETKIASYNTLNLGVSQSNVGWHIEHALLTLNGVIEFLVQSNPKEYRWKFNFIRIVVLSTKKIPRGRAKAPKIVQPSANIDRDSLVAHIIKARIKLKELESLPKNKYFKHPYFGKLTLEQTINFLEIHTNHHLKIINDIVQR